MRGSVGTSLLKYIAPVVSGASDLASASGVRNGVNFIGDSIVNRSSFDYVDRSGEARTAVAKNLGLEGSMCARYSRLMAEEVFGKKYVPANAWDLKYANEVVGSNGDLSNAQPGDMITFFNPSSPYNTKGEKNLDIRGNKREETHAALLYDFDKEGRPIIIHQYQTTLEAGPVGDIEKRRGVRAVKIIRPKSHK